uniref:NADH dehydrogenase subunit 6 n=1 Tax=Simocephalus serrulatus TaxID=117539 RepID=UPI001EE06AE6|nr:NADH dehydrogenase subunit 6 [Simocephalus serrulatus]UKB87192.1 NADH dehydrogenase subunit 6 [Simocephalus serrulatus]
MLAQFFLSLPTLFLILAFPFLNHPLAMGLLILSLTIMLAVMLGMMTMNLWISYALVLVLLGGLLVVFVYVSLLASNELFQKSTIGPFAAFILFMLMFLFMNLKQENLLSNFNLNSVSALQNKGYEWLTPLYSLELSYLTIFLILYLLLTLIVVVSITKFDYSSLRSNN